MSKLDTVREALTTHFTAEGSDAEAVKKVAEVMTKLFQLGGSSEDMLREIEAKDLEAWGLPALVARKIVRLCGGGDSGEVSRQIIVSTDDPTVLAARMKPAELVAEYDPDNPDNPFGVRLGQLSGGKRILVFNDDNTTLHVPQSVRNLRAVLDHFPERTTVLVDGLVRETYRVGDRPARFGDEHPIRPGELLQPDGYDANMIPWGSLDLTVRQVVYIGVTITKEIAQNTAGRWIYDQVRGKSVEEVGQVYPASYAKFREMQSGQQLPQLRIKLVKPQPK